MESATYAVIYSLIVYVFYSLARTSLVRNNINNSWIYNSVRRTLRWWKEIHERLEKYFKEQKKSV